MLLFVDDVVVVLIYSIVLRMYMWFIGFFSNNKEAPKRASIDTNKSATSCLLLFAGLLMQNTKDEEIRCVLGTYCFYWIAGLPEINAVSILEPSMVFAVSIPDKGHEN